MFGKVITCDKEFFFTLILYGEEVTISSKKDAKDANKSRECNAFLSPEGYKMCKVNPEKKKCGGYFWRGCCGILHFYCHDEAL